MNSDVHMQCLYTAFIFEVRCLSLCAVWSFVYSSVFFFFIFFFFQAEDGIRDLYVTGVQTCALPISSTFGYFGSSSARMRFTAYSIVPLTHCTDEEMPRMFFVPTEPSGLRKPSRSEERRVGKECRSRWSPYN